jgi:hypothetical protein
MTIPAPAVADVLAPSTPSSSSSSRGAVASSSSSAVALLPEARRLREVHYPCVASVTLAYPNDAFKVSIGADVGRRLGACRVATYEIVAVEIIQTPEL